MTIAVAPPKGERLEWLVQKCTEVGVDQLVLLVAERSVVRWDADRAARQLERLRRIAAEAAMQSRRVWLPTRDGSRAGGGGAADARSPPSRVADRSDRPMRSWRSAPRAAGRRASWPPPPTASRSATHVLRVETAAVVATTLLRATRTALR